jgi:hypothetical protein
LSSLPDLRSCWPQRLWPRSIQTVSMRVLPTPRSTQNRVRDRGRSLEEGPLAPIVRDVLHLAADHRAVEDQRRERIEVDPIEDVVDENERRLRRHLRGPDSRGGRDLRRRPLHDAGAIELPRDALDLLTAVRIVVIR